MLRRIAVVGALPLAAASCGDAGPAPEPGPQPTLAVTSVDVVDVESGEILPDRTVLVAADRIVDVVEGPPPDLSPDVEVIDGDGLYAIPGLWDMHVHMINDVHTPVPWDFHTPEPGAADPRDIYMPIYLAFGVTGTREMSGGLASLELRRRIREGEILGPHMVVGSPILDGGVPTFPEGSHILVDGPEEARAVVDSLHAAGFDFLKPYSLLLPETYRALVERADELGMPVSGELPVTVSAWEAVELGQRTIEHLTGVEFAASSREEELRAGYLARLRALNADPSPSPDEAFDIWHRSEWEPYESLDSAREALLFRDLAEHDTWVVPTLVVQRMISHADDPAVADDPHFRYIDPWSRDLEALRDEFDPERRLRPVHEHRLGVVDDLQTAGVGILAGSDTPGGFTLLEELELFVASGLTPTEALRTATVNPARYLGREGELGTIAPGRFADLVLLRGDPLRDIGNVRAIEAVIFQGHVLDRERLDRMLAQLEMDAEEWPE